MAPNATPIGTRLSRAFEKDPDHLAVIDGGGKWAMSYRQISERADYFASAVASHAYGPLVLNLTKSPAFYIAMASCFAHRRSFCPVDIQNPPQRVLDIALQFDERVVVCDDLSRFNYFDTANIRSILVGETDASILSTNFEAPTRLSEQRPCYFIATSGSTGVPKIVQVPHENATAFVDWAIPFYQIDSRTRWAQFSSTGFDLSIVDILSVLAGGGTLVSLASRLDRMRPAQAIKRAGITHWHSVPSIIPYLLIDETKPTATTCTLFTFCGEPLMAADVDNLLTRYPCARVVNTYGPTEATLFCSFFEYSQRDREPRHSGVSIGTPIPGWNFLLLNDSEHLRLVIISDNIADGYVGLSSDQFASIEFFGTKVRAFDTQDYFFQDCDRLYFSHRRDSMVKVKGNRVDLGDVEAAAKRVGLVNPVAFLNDGRLTLVVEGELHDPAAVRHAMTALLPEYSIPSTIRSNPEHPRNSNGKLDRAAIQHQKVQA